MILKLRPAIWAFALTITLTALAVPKSVGAFQSAQGMANGRGHNKDNGRDGDSSYSNNPHYQQGINQGQQDAANNRDRRYRFQTNNDADRRAYEAGYDQGYRDGSPDGNYNGQYGRNGPDGRNDNVAAQMGSQDGLNDGRTDRQTGHSNRPTQGDNYKNATRGFTGGAGQTAYKATYRQAYLPAYQQGYIGQINSRR
jgi:hypothetical protein